MSKEQMRNLISFDDVDYKKHSIGLRSGTSLFVVDKEGNIKYLTSGDVRTSWSEKAMHSFDEAVAFTDQLDLLLWIRDKIEAMFSNPNSNLK